MDLTEMLATLMLDLKMTLDSEISTAEATRAINRAVDELSRHVPRDRIYDHTWIKAVTDDSFTTPATANATSLVNAWDISAVVDGAAATLVTSWLDVPRPVAILLTDADNSVTRMTLIIKGTDADGIYREERFYRHDGKSQTGKIYFSSIYEIEINEISGNGAADTLSVGTAAPDLATGGVWVKLSNPVEPGTESIYSASGKSGTKYTLNTDYEMDYPNGKIRMKNGGSLAVSTAYYANYDRASTTINISSIIPELIRINKVLYPGDKVPEQQVAFSIWGNMLTIGSLRQGVSQGTLTDKEHITIYYEAKQAPPTLVGSGSYPDILDEVVLIGAGAYALFVEALQYEQQAVTDVASMRTELGLTTAVHTLITTALAKAAVLVTASTGNVAVALAKVTTHVESGADDSAVGALSKITDNLAQLRTKVETATDAMATALGLVSTSQLDKATTGAEDMLETVSSSGLINKLNDGGPDVPTKYGDYAKTQVQLASTRIQQASMYAQEAQMRLTELGTYISESEGWTKIADAFIAEAQIQVSLVNAIISEAGSRISQLDRYISEAQRYQEAAGTSLLIADRLKAEAQARLDNFNRILASKSEYRKKVVSVSVRQPA